MILIRPFRLQVAIFNDFSLYIGYDKVMKDTKSVSKSEEVKKTEKPQKVAEASQKAPKPKVAKPKKTTTAKKSSVVSHGVGRRKRAVSYLVASWKR